MAKTVVRPTAKSNVRPLAKKVSKKVTKTVVRPTHRQGEAKKTPLGLPHASQPPALHSPTRLNQKSSSSPASDVDPTNIGVLPLT